MSFDCILDHATNECKNDKNLGKMTKSLVSGSQGEIGTKTWEKIHSKIEQLPGKKACRNTQRMQIKNKKMQKNVFVFPHPAFRCRCVHIFWTSISKSQGFGGFFLMTRGVRTWWGSSGPRRGFSHNFRQPKKGVPQPSSPITGLSGLEGGDQLPPPPSSPVTNLQKSKSLDTYWCRPEYDRLNAKLFGRCALLDLTFQGPALK